MRRDRTALPLGVSRPRPPCRGRRRGCRGGAACPSALRRPARRPRRRRRRRPSTPGSPEPLDGLHDPGACLPDIDRSSTACARAASGGERVLVFGDFDADGLTGLAIMVHRAARGTASTAEPYVPSRLDEGHGLSLAALDARRSGRGDASSSRSTAGRRATPRSQRGRARHRRHRHRPPPRPAGPAAGARDRQPAPAGLELSGPPAGRQRRRLQGRPGCSWPTCPAGRRRPSTSPTSRPSGPSPTWRRSSARTGPSPGSGSSDRATAPRPGIAALLERAGVAPAAVDLETVSLRHRARGSTPPAGWARRSRPRGSCWPTDGRRGRAAMPTRSRRPTSTRRDLLEDGASAEARAAGRR